VESIVGTYVLYNVEVMGTKRYKVVQIPVSEDLLERLDAASKQRDQSRSAFIREACTKYLAEIREAKLVEQYERGYERMPEGEEEDSWAKMGEERLAELLAEDSW
jgi:metal-responsive CopG/Arc/MetJ family transcriptional regulator